MTFFGASDLPAMLADSGVPVVWGSVTGKGIEDEVDDEMLSGAGVDFTGRETSVVIETTPFAGLKENDTITVEGVSKKVISVHRFGDGALSRALVRPA